MTEQNLSSVRSLLVAQRSSSIYVNSSSSPANSSDDSTNIADDLSTLPSGGLEFSASLIAFITLQQIVFVLACPGNGFVIYIIKRYLNLNDNSNIFILNLAIADFFTGIASGSQIFYFFFPQLNDDFLMCMLRYQVLCAMTISSQITVFLLSFDRFVSICHPIFYDKISTRLFSVLLVVLPWTISISITAPTFLGWNVWTEKSTCSYSLILTNGYFWTISLIVSTLSIGSFSSHVRIFFAAKKFFEEQASLNELSTQDSGLSKRIRGAKVMLLITIAFTICWLPYISFPFAYANGFIKKTELDQASSWLVFLGIINSVINPFIYAWYKNDFRRAAQKSCCCWFQEHFGH